VRKLLKILGWIFGILALLIAGCVAHANYRISKDEVNAIDAEAPGRYFTVQGHRLHVRVLGDVKTDPTGVPLMMVHGFALSGHTTFLPWANDELAPKRSLILPDNLGYGFSERITTPGEYYTLKSYARDLAGILDALGIEKVDLAGHSWGGMMAAQFAQDYPARVRKLVIIDGSFFFPKSSPLEGMIHFPLGIGRAVTWHALAGGPKSYVGLICSMQGEKCEGAATTRIKDTTPALQAAMQTSRTLGSDDMDALESSVGRIATPTLVLWGSEDRIVPLSTAKRLAKELPSARLAVVENARHMPWLEEPKETARQLLDYLAAP
jgi:pimeloyl-ACP methyl ester carboxylesterase